ncbi:MAG: TPR end-of-group domain-containing protein [Pyrinomonadaceae bacterium]
MKRCPDCRRDYFDDSLLYCLDDGSALLEGPSTAEQHTITSPDTPRETAVFAKKRSISSDFPTEVIDPSKLPTFGAVNSIAVLPFANISRDADTEYFSDGLAEELLNVLSKIHGIRVAARTSAFSFKNKSATVPEIGQALNVASIVEGSIRMVGERIRIAVQLVNVADGFQIWSDTYDRTMSDIFAIQDDIAQSVVEELRTRLIGEERREEISKKVISEVAEAVRGRTSDPEAQRLLLLGRYFLDRTTRDDTAKAIDYFHQALRLDPDFALCWAELGRAFSIEAGRGWKSVKAGYARSRDAALRAVTLDPELAEGYAQLGRVQISYDWDLKSAEQSYEKAVEFAPGSSSVLDGAAVLMYKLGRLNQALELVRLALAQDPLSAAIWHNLGLIAHASGLLSESETAFRKALELAPQRIVSGSLLALVLSDQGKVDEGIDQTNREPDKFWRSWARVILFQKTGQHSESGEILEEILEKFSDGNAYQIAEIYSMLGESDNAFEWLGRALTERDPGLTHAKVNPRFKSLHVDTRWSELLAKIGFGNDEPKALNS